MPFEGLHEHLVSMIDEYSSLPERRIFDFHMHSGGVIPTGDYLRVARRYGVYSACDLTPEADRQAMSDAYGDFFTYCIWPRPDREKAGHIDWDAFRRRWVDRFDEHLRAGARFIKLKTAPWPGMTPALLPDDEHLDELLGLCADVGLPLQIHAAQPECWWPKVYDSTVCGEKFMYLRAVENMMRKHPTLVCVSVHMGSCPENPEYMDYLMREFPNYHVDTSATKWVAREISRQWQQWREFFIRWSERIFFGSDLVVREGMGDEYYASRFLVQRLMLESDYRGPNPIIDADGDCGADVPVELCGLNLPEDVLARIYRLNAEKLLLSGMSKSN